MIERIWMTTRQCADFLGVTQAYVRGEIRDGRMGAEVDVRPVRPGCRWARPSIRIYPEHLREYCQRYWPRMVARLPPAA